MKPLLGIFSAILVGTLIMLYLFRGFGPGETGALFRSKELPIPVSYFKTPATAVTKINAILAAQDWVTLAQYYELDRSGVNIARLADGSFFFSGAGEGAVKRKHPPQGQQKPGGNESVQGQLSSVVRQLDHFGGLCLKSRSLESETLQRVDRRTTLSRR